VTVKNPTLHVRNLLLATTILLSSIKGALGIGRLKIVVNLVPGFKDQNHSNLHLLQIGEE
jgi:hypothetical protein